MNLVDINTKFTLHIERVGVDIFRITVDGLTYNQPEFIVIKEGVEYSIPFEIDKEDIVPTNWDEIDYPKSKKKCWLF